MIVHNITKNTCIAHECKVADTFSARFMGLMGKKDFAPGNGLLIKPCNSIHMFFMQIPLDIVFLSKNNTVLHTIEGIKPWRVSKIVHKAYCVLELPPGTIIRSRTSNGDVLEFE